MEDLEERPSKIRKLSAPEESADPLQSAPKTPEAPSEVPPREVSTTQDVRDSEPQTETQENAQAKPALSKSQLKKLRKKEQWEAGRDDRRLKRREKHKEKQARKAAARADQAAQLASGELPAGTPLAALKKPAADGRGNRPIRPIAVPVSLILDCDFNDLMAEKEIISLGAQLTRCYSDNRTAAYRCHLAISSWGGALQERFEGLLSSNHLGWRGVRFMPENFVEAAGVLDGVMRGPEGGRVIGPLRGEGWEDEKVEVLPKKKRPRKAEAPDEEEPVAGEAGADGAEDGPNPLDAPNGSAPVPAPEPSEPPSAPSLVYLTSDSPHTLTSLSPHTSYIIGGIVDKNRHKGLCYKRAAALGIPTAKLPIGEYMTMQSRTVLAVNHVVEIMLRWLEVGDWGEAFVRVIPKRKEARLKGAKGGGDEGGEDEGEGRDEDEGEERDGDDDEGEEEVEES